MAPSAMMTIVFLLPMARCLWMILHMSSAQVSVGGDSGMNMKSAPVETPAIKANQPQCRPITSMMNAR